MRTIEIPDAGIKRYIPSDLSECNAKEYLDMSELIFRFICGNITYDDLRIHAVYKLLKMKPVEENLTEEEELLKTTNVYRLSEMIDSFFDMDAQTEQRTIKQNYIHNPIPSFKPLWRTYHGPSDQFMNLGFGEYCDALRIFMQFNATGDVALLYDLAAILYRPKKAFHFIRKRLNNYDGDVRVSYNSNHVANRAKIFRYAPYGFIYGVYLLFASFQKFISSAQVPWAGKVLDFSILFTSAPDDVVVEIDKDDIGMDAVMFSMAESGVFGSPKELNQTKAWLVLVRMYDTRIAQLKTQKLQKDADNTTT